MMIMDIPRERDEQILLMLRLRTLGHSTSAIGERLGISLENVRGTTNTIKATDHQNEGRLTTAEAISNAITGMFFGLSFTRAFILRRIFRRLS